MLLLALDTSTPAVTAGVVSLRPETGELEVLGSRVTIDARAHGELLTPHLTDAVQESGLTLSRIDAIVCGVGPGPYTGLRAGMVTAAALAHALDVPAYPVCGLDAIAAEVTAGGGPLLVVTDARRREVYWASYDELGRRVDGPWVGPPAEVSGKVPTEARVAGQGGRVYADVFGARSVEPLYPTPRGLVMSAAATIAAGEEPGPLTPLYLRKPDARVPAERKRVSL